MISLLLYFVFANNEEESPTPSPTPLPTKIFVGLLFSCLGVSIVVMFLIGGIALCIMNKKDAKEGNIDYIEIESQQSIG